MSATKRHAATAAPSKLEQHDREWRYGGVGLKFRGRFTAEATGFLGDTVRREIQQVVLKSRVI